MQIDDQIIWNIRPGFLILDYKSVIQINIRPDIWNVRPGKKASGRIVKIPGWVFETPGLVF